MIQDWRWWVTCAVLAGSLAATRLKEMHPASELTRPLSGIPLRMGDWIGTEDPPLRQQIAESLGATSYLSRTYRRGNRSVNLFIAYYANPRAGETMHSPKHCLPGGGWEPIELRTVRVAGQTGPVEINKYVLYRAGEQSLVLFWYQTPQRVIASEYLSKAWLIWDTLRMKSPASAIVRVTVGGSPGALEDGLEFSAHAMREMARCYGRP
ncbi:MAG: exosortase C-terminal domain/associated protein EpsI [Bryobacteraceae bacterium]